MDHLPQHLDRRALRPHDLVAYDARDHLVVPDPPHRDPLVPLEQSFGELVELLVVPSLHVHLDEVETRLRDSRVACLAERGRDTPNLPEPGRVEAAAVPQHTADRLVLPGRHLLEHVELGRHVLEGK